MNEHRAKTGVRNKNDVRSLFNLTISGIQTNLRIEEKKVKKVFFPSSLIDS